MMRTADAHQTARQGQNPMGLGRLAEPQDISSFLHQPRCYSPAEHELFNAGPPPQLVRRTGRSTLVFLMPGSSILELQLACTNSRRMTVIDVDTKFAGQSFLTAREPAAWVRVDNPLLGQVLDPSDLRPVNARGLTIIFLVLRALNMPPLTGRMVSSTSTTLFRENSLVRVRMFDGRLSYAQTDVQSLKAPDTITIRTFEPALP